MNKHYPYITARAGLTEKWSPSDDRYHYRETLRNGQPNLYAPNSIDYKYNADGFRCDEFTAHADISVVFVGCSITEGIGIHQSEVWATQVLENIRNKTQKTIPYWNLALGGTGIDTSANVLYWFSKKKKIDYIFANFPPVFRRELSNADGSYSTWASWSCHSPVYGPICTEPQFQEHQTRRSFMLLDTLRRLNNSTMYCSFWGGGGTDFIKNEFLDIHFSEWTKLPEIVDYGRDDIHPGPATQKVLAEWIWKDIEQYF